MHQNLPALVEDTAIHGAGMQVDAAVQWLLVGVTSHEVSSFSGSERFSQCQHSPPYTFFY
jgi:hypothetical protein